MDPATPFFVFLTLFQGTVAVAILARGTSGLRPRLAQAILLVVNALLTAGDAFRAEDIASDGRVLRALDATTPYLLAAYLTAGASAQHLRRTYALFLVGGALHAVLVLVWPVAFGTYSDLFLRAYPYYASLAALLWISSRRGAAEAYVAIAFLPRPLFFAIAHVRDPLAFSGVGGTLLALNFVGYLALFGVALLATFWLARRGGTIRTGALLAAAMGVLTGISALLITGSPIDFFLNYATLALVRPAFLVAAFAPFALPEVFAASAIVSAASAIAGVVGSFAFGGESAGGIVLGAGLGLAGVGLRQVFRARRSEEENAVGLPHWKRLLVALRGSSSFEPPSAPDRGWSQEALATSTGIPRPRISEFPARANAGPVPLVRVHRGRVEGVRGVRTFYTLTPEGERQADAIVAQLDSQNQETSPRSRPLA